MTDSNASQLPHERNKDLKIFADVSNHYQHNQNLILNDNDNAVHASLSGLFA